MNDRVALVTGAARGIGAATTRSLASKGYRVVALDWCVGDAGAPYPMPTRADLEKVADGDRVTAHVADVRDPAQLGQCVAETVDRWGRLDVAVAAASAIAGGMPLWETDSDQLDLLLDMDLRGVWNTAAAAVPAMLAGLDPSGCRFFAVASAAATHGLFHLAGYNAVKHAVVGLVKGLAADLVGTGVTACAVSPGSTQTNMLDATAAIYGLPDSTTFASHQLLRRLIAPDEVAAAIAFCCSREGAVVNGSVVHSEGGFTP